MITIRKDKVLFKVRPTYDNPLYNGLNRRFKGILYFDTTNFVVCHNELEELLRFRCFKSVEITYYFPRSLKARWWQFNYRTCYIEVEGCKKDVEVSMYLLNTTFAEGEGYWIKPQDRW